MSGSHAPRGNPLGKIYAFPSRAWERVGWPPRSGAQRVRHRFAMTNLHDCLEYKKGHLSQVAFSLSKIRNQRLAFGWVPDCTWDCTWASPCVLYSSVRTS